MKTKSILHTINYFHLNISTPVIYLRLIQYTYLLCVFSLFHLLPLIFAVFFFYHTWKDSYLHENLPLHKADPRLQVLVLLSDFPFHTDTLDFILSFPLANMALSFDSPKVPYNVIVLQDFLLLPIIQVPYQNLFFSTSSSSVRLHCSFKASLNLSRFSFWQRKSAANA